MADQLKLPPSGISCNVTRDSDVEVSDCREMVFAKHARADCDSIEDAPAGSICISGVVVRAPDVVHSTMGGKPVLAGGDMLRTAGVQVRGR